MTPQQDKPKRWRRWFSVSTLYQQRKLSCLIIPLIAFLAAISKADEPRGGETVTNSIGMKLRLIEAGTFLMGSPISDNDALEEEKPQHRVQVSGDFYLGVTEVTQGQWEAVMGSPGPWKDKVRLEGPHCAATFVSWRDATEFCARLSEKEGVNYRLPTEAEWEYACRAGTTTRYSFGDSEVKLGDYAWFGFLIGDGNTKDEPYAHQVATKRANPWGLHDMHGNVWEWCQDWFGEYQDSAVVDPMGPSQGEKRVVRGGNWYDFASFCRSSSRFGLNPGGRGIREGFRVARDP